MTINEMKREVQLRDAAALMGIDVHRCVDADEVEAAIEERTQADLIYQGIRTYRVVRDGEEG